jgi:hypothetical protein
MGENRPPNLAEKYGKCTAATVYEAVNSLVLDIYRAYSGQTRRDTLIIMTYYDSIFDAEVSRPCIHLW